jgi:hypothetical protein
MFGLGYIIQKSVNVLVSYNGRVFKTLLFTRKKKIRRNDTRLGMKDVRLLILKMLSNI